jgi:hypothetical protein
MIDAAVLLEIKRMIAAGADNALIRNKFRGVVTREEILELRKAVGPVKVPPMSAVRSGVGRSSSREERGRSRDPSEKTGKA